MNQYKSLFPIFEKNPSLHYLDSAATALKPVQVLLKLNEYYSEYSANIHRGLYPMSEKATEEYEKVREVVAGFIKAQHPSEIIFTSGATDGINTLARGWGEANIGEGDEIVATISEHHSNFVPWQQLAKRKKAVFKTWTLNDYQLKSEEVKTLITTKTKVLAITHVSNVLGIVNPIKEIIATARKINPEICVVVDGSQAVVHIPVDVADLDADFYAFSGHKLYGPTGVGVLYGKARRLLQMEPAKYGGGMISTVSIEESTWAAGPEKFEAGTPPIAQVLGLGAAVEFVTKIGMETIAAEEKKLTCYAIEKLKKFPWVKLFKPESPIEQVGVISFVSKDEISPHDFGDILGRKHNVCIRGGHHCTMPMHTALNMAMGSLRVSLGIYNDEEDIDKLFLGLHDAREMFRSIDEEMDYEPQPLPL